MYMPLGATGDPTAQLLALTAWTPLNSGAGSALPIVTPNAGTAPDGTATATRVQFNRGTSAGNRYAILRLGTVVVAGQSYTGSVYAKLAPGAAPATLGVRLSSGGTALTDARVSQALDSSWRRIKVTGLAQNNNAMDFDILLWSSIVETTDSADVLLWNPRVDLGTAPTGVDYAGNGGIDPRWLIAAGLGLLFFGKGR